jgi:phospholipid/cholesterol/gamma-HCH transport system substrate-binding protein
MRSFRDRNPIAVGLLSIGVIGVFVGLAFMVGVLHLLEDTYGVRAVFADAAGIRPGDDVKVAGVKAGRVTGIEADHEHGNVVVTMVVNKGVELGPETRAEIALETLLGTKYVRLSGPVATPYLESMASDERVIPIDRTTTPFDVFELTTLGTRRVQQTDTEKLNQFINQLAEVTSGNPDDVKTLLHSVADVADDITARDDQLAQLIERFDALSKLLAEKDQTLVGLIDQSQAVLDVVSRREQELRLGLRGGDELASVLAQIVGQNKTEIDAILTTLHPALDVIDRRNADINRGLAAVGPGALGLARATAHGPWQDIYVRAVGPDFVQLLRDYGSQLPTAEAP